MELNIGIHEKPRALICEGLQKFLANTYAVYLKTQNFHWNIVSPGFYSLHILLESQYEELAKATDEIAERIRALGFFVEASFTSFKTISSIPDEEKVLTSVEMLKHLIQAHETLIRHARTLADLIEKEKDVASNDMLGRLVGMHEKMTWMLRSHLV